jgi:hypothetical protein
MVIIFFHMLELKESINRISKENSINKKEATMNKENTNQLQQIESIPLKH